MEISNLFYELYYFLKYDVLKVPLEIPENLTYKALNHRIKIVKLKDGYIAESVDFPNLYASGDDLNELREAYYDTVLTYFDIPRFISKRRSDDFKFNLDDGTIIHAKSYVPHTSLAGA